MQFYKELTEWAQTTPNHVYLLSDSKDKMYAYIPEGTDRIQEFKNPIRFSTRGRKFQPVANRWNFRITVEKPANPVWQVLGSKGDTYKVELVDSMYTCTCSGFKFRGACRHITEISGKHKPT
jgi:hypothetical protein